LDARGFSLRHSNKAAIEPLRIESRGIAPIATGSPFACTGETVVPTMSEQEIFGLFISGALIGVMFVLDKIARHLLEIKRLIARSMNERVD
jgi:hypothetical protein